MPLHILIDNILNRFVCFVGTGLWGPDPIFKAFSVQPLVNGLCGCTKFSCSPRLVPRVLSQVLEELFSQAFSVGSSFVDLVVRYWWRHCG